MLVAIQRIDLTRVERATAIPTFPSTVFPVAIATIPRAIHRARSLLRDAEAAVEAVGAVDPRRQTAVRSELSWNQHQLQRRNPCFHQLL